MRKNTNTAHIEGRIYQHDLELKEVKNQSSANFGKQYIAGKLEIATDNKGMNIIPVNFTYVTKTTAKGGANKTYAELMKIINDGKTWVADGPDSATKVTVDTALALNDFVAQDGSMVSIMMNNGGFVTVVGDVKEDENLRSTFRTDILITGVRRVEADPEKFIDEDYVAIRGAVFDFRNSLLPVEFVVKNPGGMAYFEDMDVSGANPVYTQVWGKINFTTKDCSEKIDSAFGEAQVDIRQRKVREWIITGAAKVPYEFGEEGVMTEEEVVKAMQDREVYLADIKKRREEYQASKTATSTPAFGATAAPAPNGPVAAGKFSF